jgi:phage/plasmid-like protein (TIGR03299 family)
MAHNIEQYEDKAAFISAHTSAWHQLGTVVDHTFDAAEAMKVAHLGGWNVRKLPVPPIYDESTGQWLETDQDFLVGRTNPFTGKVERLGSVGTDYTVIQNEEHAEFLNTLAGEGGAHFETAGSLNGGKRMFLTMKLPQHILVGGQDRVDLYLAASNSHDGTSPFTIYLTPIRVVCANTEHIAIKRANHIFKIRHTSGAGTRIQKAREILGMSFKYVEEFEKEAEKLINAELTTTEFDRIIKAVFPPSASDSTRSKNSEGKRRDDLLGLFNSAATQANIRGTRWAGYNAITEYVDHTAPVKGKGDRDLLRANRALTSPDVIKTKQRAFDLLAV